MAELPKVSFFYGPNGSGKSSIAKKVAEQNADGDTVFFSENYISRLLSPTEDIPGVFTIRDAPENIQNRLDELDGTSAKPGLLAKAQDKYQKAQKDYDKYSDVIKDRRTTLENDIWIKQKEFVVANTQKERFIDFVFEGKPGRKNLFREKCQDILKSGASHRTLAKIHDDYETLQQQQFSVLELLPDLPELITFTEAELQLASERVISGSESALNDHFNTESHKKWAIDGLQYLNHDSSACPYCRQEVSEDFLERVRALLDENYSEATRTLNRMLLTSQNNATTMERFLERITEHSSADENLIALVESLYNSWQTNSAHLSSKLNKPYETIELTNGAVELSSIKKSLRETNSDLQTKIDLARNRDETLLNLREETWTFFVREIVKADFDTYNGAIQGAEQAVESNANKIPKRKREWDDLSEERSLLLEQVSDSGPTVEQINELLSSLGFFNFELVPDSTRNNYHLVRENGEDASSSLSEGEKTFIAFLYFYESTLQQASSVEQARPLVAIIDDPISSLDSDTLFLIAILTRSIIDRCDYRNAKDQMPSRLEQVFLLTHNAYFLKEVAYHIDGLNRNKSANLAYYVLKKGPTPDQKHTTIVKHGANPISSVYEALWTEVREAAGRDEATHSTQNAMRRIIENYFRSQGGVNVDEILNGQEISAAEHLVCRMLVSWLHDGSHNIPWDTDYSFNQFDQSIYHSAFQKLFKFSGQIDHYNFMMRIEADDR